MSFSCMKTGLVYLLLCYCRSSCLFKPAGLLSTPVSWIADRICHHQTFNKSLSCEGGGKETPKANIANLSNPFLRKVLFKKILSTERVSAKPLSIMNNKIDDYFENSTQESVLIVYIVELTQLVSSCI